MRGHFGRAMFTIIAGLGLAGCGGRPVAGGESAQTTALSAPVAPFPAYIVYLQPRHNVNPLYADVRNFIHHNLAGNLAASYPPHVSLTGFFPSSQPLATLRSEFHKAVDDVGIPFGQPMIQPKKGAKPGTSAVYCNWGEKLITLHVRMPRDYKKFRSDVQKRLGAAKHKKGASHITLFESNDPNLKKTRFETLCTAAHTFFGPRIASYNSKNDGDPAWDVTLLLAPHDPTPAQPLHQADAVIEVHVNHS